jgi:hypothetical protein
MRLAIAIATLLALLAAPAAFAADNDQPRGVPLLNSVEPESGKAGDIITARGDYLDKSRLADLYLTNGKVDVKTEIVSQGDSFVKFKIPVDAFPGRYTLMILMAGPEPKLLEQPVSLRVQ